MTEHNTTAPEEMKKALEAYNTIREYCRKQDDLYCENCLFSDEADMCILTGDIPENWQELDLD